MRGSESAIRSHRGEDHTVIGAGSGASARAGGLIPSN
jgi:hypothetical protein